MYVLAFLLMPQCSMCMYSFTPSCVGHASRHYLIRGFMSHPIIDMRHIALHRDVIVRGKTNSCVVRWLDALCHCHAGAACRAVLAGGPVPLRPARATVNLQSSVKSRPRTNNEVHHCIQMIIAMVKHSITVLPQDSPGLGPRRCGGRGRPSGSE